MSSGKPTCGRKSSVQTELGVRAPTRQDAGEIAEILNAHACAMGRPADETPEGVGRWFDLEALDPTRDMFLAVEGARIMGYADVSAPDDEREVVYLDLRVPPGRERVAELLLEEVERRAAELADGFLRRATCPLLFPSDHVDGSWRAA